MILCLQSVRIDIGQFLFLDSFGSHSGLDIVDEHRESFCYEKAGQQDSLPTTKARLWYQPSATIFEASLTYSWISTLLPNQQVRELSA